MKKVYFIASLFFAVILMSPMLFLGINQTQADMSYPTWGYTQSDWSGGTSSDVVSIYQYKNWNKYSSISGNLTADTAINNPGSGELVSSPINLEGREVNFIGGAVCAPVNGAHVYGRTAATIGGLSSAPWVEYTPVLGTYLDGQYMQYKVSFTSSDCYSADDIDLAISNVGIGGWVYDENGHPSDNFTVTGDTCTSYTWPHDGRGGPGYFLIVCDYTVGDTTKTVTVSSPGYTAQTKIVPITQNAWNDIGMAMIDSTRLADHAVGSPSYNGDTNFDLVKLSAVSNATTNSNSSQNPTELPRTGANEVIDLSSKFSLAVLISFGWGILRKTRKSL